MADLLLEMLDQLVEDMGALGLADGACRPRLALAMRRAFELGRREGAGIATPRILAPEAAPKVPARWGKVAELTSEDFAGDILSAVGDSMSVDAREVLLRIKQRRRCHKLIVNGRQAGLVEVRQMAARLAREGKLALDGDTLGVA